MVATLAGVESSELSRVAEVYHLLVQIARPLSTQEEEPVKRRVLGHVHSVPIEKYSIT